MNEKSASFAIGPGASGLCLAYKLQRSFRRIKLTVSMFDLWEYILRRVFLMGDSDIREK